MFFAKRVRGGSTNAKIAQLVEHDLAKVGVAGSSPVFRSESFYHESHLQGHCKSVKSLIRNGYGN